MLNTKPSPSILAAHDDARNTLPFDDRQDIADADRGFLASPRSAVIPSRAGGDAWNGEEYAFLSGEEGPDTVHPSLWRQAVLTARSGLFEVVPGIYQVRGLDLSNITFIEGDTGVIIIDPLTSIEPAEAALALYRHVRGERPVMAIIYTHSHIDHFGGALGVVSQAQVDRGEVVIIAPEGFLEHAVSENIFAGTAMARRAGFMYGSALPRGVAGQVGSGLGLVPSSGTVSLVPPTHSITHTGETLTIDGVEMVFQMAPDSEAPAEMHIYFPSFRALCIAENATHTQHNLLTLRGALVRDPHAWAGHLSEAIERYGDVTEVLFSPHHWPTWGKARVTEFLTLQRDLYAYLHDQTLRLINQGLNGAEIAETLQLPPVLENAWHARGYYGSLSHNVKAIYQRYMGWFDGNPARLWPHPPEAAAARYVEAIGGIERTLQVAHAAYDSGDYRWAATLLDHVVFTNRFHAEARELYASTLEQLAYGSENATWRNFFLTGALELRGTVPVAPGGKDSVELMRQLTIPQILDTIAFSVNGPRSWDVDLILDLRFVDLGERYRLRLRNGVLSHRLLADDSVVPDETASEATEGHATIETSRAQFLLLLTGAIGAETIIVGGDTRVPETLLSMLDQPNQTFEILFP